LLPTCRPVDYRSHIEEVRVDVSYVALVPVGRIDIEELEAAVARVARVVRQPLELRGPLPLPHESEDAGRGQHRAAVLIERLVARSVMERAGRLIGSDDAAARPPVRPAAFIFVTDVDLYTAKTAGVLAALSTALGGAVVSVRRQREAFYRRKADPTRQRLRLAKELLRMWGRLKGAGECANPTCALAPTRGVPDLDSKSEQFCRDCAAHLFEGRLRL
jgi:predicted Zn-dependent protease